MGSDLANSDIQQVSKIDNFGKSSSPVQPKPGMPSPPNKIGQRSLAEDELSEFSDPDPDIEYNIANNKLLTIFKTYQ